MTHDASFTQSRFSHMSPTAVAMALMLHVAVGAALWWAGSSRPVEEPENPITITMEQEPAAVEPTPPEPEPAPSPVVPAPPPSPSPAPTMRLGLAPAAPATEPQATPGDVRPAPPSAETPAEEAARPEASPEP
ncbi:MAG: hypothetical protein ACOY4R_18745, partial [Pseudomonadota bacterium]